MGAGNYHNDGGVLGNNYPIEQYPKVAPPSVTISATYPGASAETVENSVTQVIEQSLTGIDNHVISRQAVRTAACLLRSL